MGMKEPVEELTVSHGICSICAARQQMGEVPTVVISRKKAGTLPILEGLLRGTPEIRVVVDRRTGERRQQPSPAEPPAGRRTMRDRRQAVSYVVV
jgi:hypothetical protein